MNQPPLFELPEPTPSPEPSEKLKGKPRLRMAERNQVVIRCLSLDDLLPPEDDARVVWEFVCQSDLSALYESIEAVEGAAGRNATDPRILMSLWLLATLKAVASARELDRLSKKHLSYQWLCGDVSVNYGLLAAFRVKHAEVLDQLLTEQVASLMHAKAVTLETVAQDGMRVRADAGASSFRRQETLDECLAQAERHLADLRRQAEEDPGLASRQQAAARERAARERVEKLRAACEACRELQAKKEQRKRDSMKYPARASTTDPDARKMKMADGGFRPAYNVQFGTDVESGVVVGVDVVKEGTDGGQAAPMVRQIEERTNVRPTNFLVDGGFTSKDDLEELNVPEEGRRVYAPVREETKQQAKGQDPFAAKPRESARVTEWRTRMGTAAAQQLYKHRASTAEWTNAQARNRGLTQFPVRGLAKVRTIALWFALAHNLQRWATLRAAGKLEAK